MLGRTEPGGAAAARISQYLARGSPASRAPAASSLSNPFRAVPRLHSNRALRRRPAAR
jgi:hypothetical protein